MATVSLSARFPRRPSARLLARPSVILPKTSNHHFFPLRSTRRHPNWPTTPVRAPIRAIHDRGDRGCRWRVYHHPPSLVFFPLFLLDLHTWTGTNKKKDTWRNGVPRHPYRTGSMDYAHAHAVPMAACRASLRLGMARDGPSTMQIVCVCVSSLLGQARRTSHRILLSACHPTPPMASGVHSPYRSLIPSLPAQESMLLYVPARPRSRSCIWRG